MSRSGGLEALPPFDPYAELGIRPDADRATIEAAYRALMKRHHPDVAPDPVAGEARGKRLNAARRWLTDPDLRRRYDDAHRFERSRPPTAWEPPPTTADDLLRVHYDRRPTPSPSPPTGFLFGTGMMLVLGALVVGDRSGLVVVGGLAGLALALYGGASVVAGTPLWPARSAHPARPSRRPTRRAMSFRAILVVGLVFLGFGALIASLSIWLILFAFPALVVGLGLTLYGGIGVGVGVAMSLWSRLRSS
jgi:hypothetical protein